MLFLENTSMIIYFSLLLSCCFIFRDASNISPVIATHLRGVKKKYFEM